MPRRTHASGVREQRKARPLRLPRLVKAKLVRQDDVAPYGSAGADQSGSSGQAPSDTS